MSVGTLYVPIHQLATCRPTGYADRERLRWLKAQEEPLSKEFEFPLSVSSTSRSEKLCPAEKSKLEVSSYLFEHSVNLAFSPQATEPVSVWIANCDREADESKRRWPARDRGSCLAFLRWDFWLCCNALLCYIFTLRKNLENFVQVSNIILIAWQMAFLWRSYSALLYIQATDVLYVCNCSCLIRERSLLYFWLWSLCFAKVKTSFFPSYKFLCSFTYVAIIPEE